MRRRTEAVAACRAGNRNGDDDDDKSRHSTAKSIRVFCIAFVAFFAIGNLFFLDKSSPASSLGHHADVMDKPLVEDVIVKQQVKPVEPVQNTIIKQDTVAAVERAQKVEKLHPTNTAKSAPKNHVSINTGGSVKLAGGGTITVKPGSNTDSNKAIESTREIVGENKVTVNRGEPTDAGEMIASVPGKTSTTPVDTAEAKPVAVARKRPKITAVATSSTKKTPTEAKPAPTDEAEAKPEVNKKPAKITAVARSSAKKTPTDTVDEVKPAPTDMAETKSAVTGSTTKGATLHVGKMTKTPVAGTTTGSTLYVGKMTKKPVEGGSSKKKTGATLYVGKMTKTPVAGTSMGSTLHVGKMTKTPVAAASMGSTLHVGKITKKPVAGSASTEKTGSTLHVGKMTSKPDTGTTTKKTDAALSTGKPKTLTRKPAMITAVTGPFTKKSAKQPAQTLRGKQDAEEVAQSKKQPTTRKRAMISAVVNHKTTPKKAAVTPEEMKVTETAGATTNVVREEHTTNNREERCLPLTNSNRWLKTTRLGNVDLNMTNDFVKSTLLDYMMLPKDAPPSAFHDSLCHENSKFMTWEDDESTKPGPLQRWALRLLYLVIHDHQHRHAAKEAKARLSCQANQDEMQEKARHAVGKFDYECPDAKFLVVPLVENGLGSNLRHIFFTAYALGVLTDRVVLFMNDVKTAGKARDKLQRSIEDPWVLASCDRHDFQCFFLPPSPCVLTKGEINGAPIIETQEHFERMYAQTLPPELESPRVLVMRWGAFVLNYEPPSRAPMYQKLASMSRDLLRRMRATGGDSPALKMMEMASHTIQDNERNKLGRPYSERIYQESPFAHAVVFYSLRPNLMYQQKMEMEMKRIVPSHFVPAKALGLPIRASDKCSTMESECLPFDSYMDLAKDMWQEDRWQLGNKTLSQKKNRKALSLVLTSESASTLASSRTFENQTAAFPFEFVRNEKDVVPGTGSAFQYLRSPKYRHSADEVMMSSILALKMQLLPKHLVANCCSNFHELMLDYRLEGCGAVKKGATSQCLWDLPDPKYRLCCHWTKSKECKEKKENGKWNKG